MICCCCLWLVLLVTGNRSARIIEISRFFIFLYFIQLEKTFGFDFSGGGKEGRQEEENKVKSKTAGVLDHDNGIQRKREKRTRERERSCRTGGRLALRLIPSGLLLIPIALFMKLFLLLLLFFSFVETYCFVLFFFLVFLHC
ncbi:unnamed protein product [Sphagnum troendelagicum]|uniref:Uncharacterized protein n=1 Tax=Sphagnum troendelagicum TaxID=128251 RepID=A0ABP0TTJ0_9BRYO